MVERPRRPPVCSVVWSSRETVGEGHLRAFQQAAHALIEADQREVLLALRTPQGLLTTGSGVDLSNLDVRGLVAVHDVDPVRGVMLCAGTGEPSAWAGVLWLVLRHKEEVGGVVMETGPVNAGDKGASREPARPARTAPFAATRSRGWGFEEADDNAASDTGVGAGSQVGPLVEWAAWILNGIRSSNRIRLVGDHVLQTGDDLTKAMDAYVTTRQANTPKKP